MNLKRIFVSILFVLLSFTNVYADRITDYDSLGVSGFSYNDIFPFVDVSEANPSDQTKIATFENFQQWTTGKNIIPIGRYSGDLDAAVAALDVVGNAGEDFVIVIDQATVMSADVDLSSLSNAASITLSFLSPAGVITTNGNALTLAQGISDSVTWQIFSGTGVAFTAGSFDFVRASWWTTNSTPGTTDMTDAIEAAIAALPSTGGTVRITGLNRITNQISLPYLVNLEGETRGYGLITSGYSNTPINATIYADGCDGLLYAAPYTGGFSTLRNINVRGETGGYVGIKILAYDVSLENVSVHGFLDGIGIWADYVYRFKWQNLQIQACGLGMYFVQYVQAGEIDGVVIENCTAGIYAMAGPFNGLTINNATIESIGTGTASTSFPGTGLFTADATMLTDLGKTQATLEGAMFFKYLTGNIQGYFEKTELVTIYAGSGCNLNVRGSYFQDESCTTKPYFIYAKRANSINFHSNYILTDGSERSTDPFFNINSKKPNRFTDNYMIDSDTSGTFGGTVYEDDTNAALYYTWGGVLQNAAGAIYGYPSLIPGAAVWRTVAITAGTGDLPIDMLSGGLVYVSVTQNIASITTSNQLHGDTLEIHFEQDGTGGRTITFPANFAVTWSDTGNLAGKRASIKLRYHVNEAKWLPVSQVAWH